MQIANAIQLQSILLLSKPNRTEIRKKQNENHGKTKEEKEKMNINDSSDTSYVFILNNENIANIYVIL